MMAAVTSGQGAGTIRLAGPRGRWVLAAAVLGSSLALLDSTVVNVALPTIGRDLGASLAGLQWTVTGYTLSLAGLILLGGSLGDRAGRRPYVDGHRGRGADAWIAGGYPGEFRAGRAAAGCRRVVRTGRRSGCAR